MTIDIRPRTIRDPFSGVSLNTRIRAGPSQEKSPKKSAQFFLSKFNISSQHKREKKFVLFKERPTDILIERVSEVVDKIQQSAL